MIYGRNRTNKLIYVDDLGARNAMFRVKLLAAPNVQGPPPYALASPHKEERPTEGHSKYFSPIFGLEV